MTETETIKKVLIKHTEPKLNGMSAHEIATLILNALQDNRAEEMYEQSAKQSNN